MNGEQIDLYGLQFHRKADNFNSVTLTAPISIALKLQVISAEELYGYAEQPFVCEDFRIETPQYFILERNGDMFLVNTEGYDYARYILRLV